MVKISMDVSTPQLNKVINKLNRLIKTNIESVMLNEGVPFLIELIMAGFDTIEERGDHPDDPTRLVNWRQEFEDKLNRDFHDTFIFQGDRLIIKLGESRFLGYPTTEAIDPADNTPIVWLVFYLEGLMGEWAFIDPVTYERFKGAGSYEDRWGRFGQGFMISREAYDEEGWGRIFPWELLEHPLSNSSPVDIFRIALDEFQIKPFIQKAISAAVQGKRL